jgi:hypothetical protein
MFHKSKLFLESGFSTAAENIKDFSVFSWALNFFKQIQVFSRSFHGLGNPIYTKEFPKAERSQKMLAEGLLLQCKLT